MTKWLSEIVRWSGVGPEAEGADPGHDPQHGRDPPPPQGQHAQPRRVDVAETTQVQAYDERFCIIVT